MRVDITSMFFNSKIEGKTATPAWSTSIGENDIRSYKLGVSQLIDGLTLNVCIDKENLDISGGSDSCDLLYFCVFDKISVNGKLLPNVSYIIYLVREHSNSHEGRIRLCYPPYAKYTKEDGTIICNENSNKEIARFIGCTPDGCWFVYDISVIDQNILNFDTKVVNASQPVLYQGESKDRSAEWNRMLLDNDDVLSEEELGKILGEMYNNAGTGFQVASIYVFGIKYGKYLSGCTLKSIIQYANLPSSLDTELNKAYKLYQSISKNKFNISSSKALDELLSERKALPLQQIFYGAPGTGKSNTIKREVEDKGRLHFRTTFHPDSDYSTFVGCYKPTMVENPVREGSGNEAKQEDKNRISYSFVPQSFTKAYCEAWNKYDGSENAEPVFLIIEEINRGSCAQIFGDVFQLLDREIDGERCGFSTYPIDADEDLKDFLEKGVRKDGTQWLTNKDGIKDGKLCLPPNLCIWATMNTSDQSLFPMDSAFKRRWEWKYVPVNHKDAQKFHIAIGEKRYNWDQFIVAVNKKVFEATQSADKQLGNRFCRADKILNPDANADCHEFEISINQLIGKVMFYLWEEVCKDAPEDEQINFMRIKLDSTTSEYFTFQDLYDGKTTSKDKVLNQEELLQAFMDYLGVEEEKDEQSENPGMNTAQPVDNGQGELPAEGVDSIEVENISSSGEGADSIEQ